MPTSKDKYFYKERPSKDWKAEEKWPWGNTAFRYCSPSGVCRQTISEAVVPAPRRSTRKKPERNYVVSFSAITGAEGGEDGGIEYDFRWQKHIDNEVIGGKPLPVHSRLLILR